MLLSLLVFLSISTDTTYALVNCLPRNTLIDAGRELTHKVGFYDGITPMDAKDFAAKEKVSQGDVEKRFNGSGVFTCDDAWGNGQLVSRQNTVTTVLHTFLKDKSDCTQSHPLSKCAFVYKEGLKMKVVYAKKILSSGTCKARQKLDDGND